MIEIQGNKCKINVIRKKRNKNSYYLIFIIKITITICVYMCMNL